MLVERYAVARTTATWLVVAMTAELRARRNVVFIGNGCTSKPHRSLFVLNCLGNPCVVVYSEQNEQIVTFLPPRALFNQTLSAETQEKIRALIGLRPEHEVAP